MKQRPMATLIFGILSIGLGLLSLVSPLLGLMAKALNHTKTSNPVLDAMNADPDYVKFTQFSMGIGVVFGLALLTFGIGILLLKNWARLGLIIYAVVALVYSPISSYIAFPMMKSAFARLPNIPPGMVSGMVIGSLGFGLLISVGYASLLLFFMTRQNVIDACNVEQIEAAPTL